MKSAALYILERSLGKGAIGSVYLAREGQRQVALKFLQNGLAPQTQHFFKEEVKLLSRLAHPNLIQIYDFFEAGDHSSLFEIPSKLRSEVPRDAPCFVMQFSPGRPVDTLQDISISTATEIFIQTLAGLNYLHARNILHRDLKPSNLYWTEDGRVKILDFSVSLNLQEKSAAQPNMGTLTYMPPESFAGEFDPRGDLFSLAVVFYFMLAGRFPYDRPTTPQALSSLKAPVPLRELRPELPEYLSDLISKMLALSPAQRPASTRTILKVIAAHSDREDLAIAAPSDPRVFQKPPLVGRDKALQTLLRLSQPRSDALGPNLLLLSGPAGVGRSRLLEEWKWAQLLRSGFFYPLAPGQASPWWEQLAKKMGDEEVHRLEVDFSCYQDYLLKKLKEKFAVLACSDLHQWPTAELATLKIFLANLQRNKISVAVALEFNLELAELNFDFLEDAGAVPEQIDLKDLSPQQTRDLLRHAAFDSPLSAETEEEICKASGGRPLLALELLRAHLTGQMDHLPESLEEAARQRMQKLPVASRALLALILTHPTATTWEEASICWLDSPQAWEEALFDLDSRGITAARDPSHPHLDLAHPSLKDLWVKNLDPQEIRAAHRAWLGYFSKKIDPEKPSNLELVFLLHHALGCDDLDAQAQWGPKAVKAAADLGDYTKAIAWSEKVLPVLRSDWDRCTIYAYRAPYSYRLGKFDEALKAYDEWYKLRPDDETQLQKARYYFNTGLVMFSAKRDHEAYTRLQACVQTGDNERHPVLRPQHARAHNLLAALEERRSCSDDARQHLEAALKLGAGDPLLEGETQQRLGALAQNEMRFAEAEQHFQCSLRLYRSVAAGQAEAIALQSLGMLQKEMGRITESLEHLNASRQQARRAGETLQWARYEGNRGTALLEAGDYGGALESMESSWQMLRILGSEEERLIAQLQLTAGYLSAGNRDKFYFHLQQLENNRNTLEHMQLWDLVLQLQADAAYHAADMLRAELLFREAAATKSRSTLLHLFYELGALRAQIWLHQIDPAELSGLLAKTKTLNGPSFAAWHRSLTFISRDPRELSEADLAEDYAQLEALENTELRLELLQWRAFHLKRRGLSRIAQKFAALAKKLFNQILNSLPEELKMDYEKNRNLASFEKALAETELEAPKNIPPAPIHAKAPSTAAISEERFKQFCEIGRQVAQKLGLEDILERVMDAAIELSSAERGFLILKSETGEIKGLGDYAIQTARRIAKENLNPADPQFSVSAVKGALEQGIPLLTDNAEEDARLKGAQSVHQYQLKSILVVPLELEGDILGAIYLDHRFQPDCFSQNDIAIVTGFAAQAALAIQKAKIMEELKRAKLKLEAKVEDQEQRLSLLSEELTQARKGLRYDYKEIIGRSPAMMKVFELLDHVTTTKIPVWIWGDSGTGKELIARSLHFNSPRKNRAFVSENCSAIPENLLESELFGHKKGAFTHAESDRVGLFEQADGGTLFLDEVADMSMGMQVKLLRVLQEGEIRPLGTNKKVQINVRLVTASNKDLAQLVKEGKFRQDLFYRINGMTIKLPPLTERKEDIPLLVHHIIKKIAKEYELKPSEVTKEGFAILMQQPWHGNIRELEGVVRNLLLFANGKTIGKDLINLHAGLVGDTPTPAPSVAPDEPLSLPEDLEEERKGMLELFRKHRLDKEKVSEELGISLKSVYARMERFGIPKKKLELHQFIEKHLGGKS